MHFTETITQPPYKHYVHFFWGGPCFTVILTLEPLNRALMPHRDTFEKLK